MNRKSLVLDFDGVLNSYTSGWTGIEDIPDPPVKGALAFCIEAVKHFDVYVHSSRCRDPKGLSAIHGWLVKHGFPVFPEGNHGIMEVVSFKPPAWLTIDDRCFLFHGQFPSMEEINGFVPWNKKDGAP